MDPLNKSFAENLKICRIANEFTLAELGEKTGINPKRINQIEGFRANVSIKEVCALAYALKCDIGLMVNSKAKIKIVWE